MVNISTIDSIAQFSFHNSSKKGSHRPKKWPVTLHSHPDPTPCFGEIVPQCIMLRASIIPECDSSRLPFVADRETRVAYPLRQIGQECFTLSRIHFDNTAREVFVNVQGSAAGYRMSADNWVSGHLFRAIMGEGNFTIMEPIIAAMYQMRRVRRQHTRKQWSRRESLQSTRHWPLRK